MEMALHLETQLMRRDQPLEDLEAESQMGRQGQSPRRVKDECEEHRGAVGESEMERSVMEALVGTGVWELMEILQQKSGIV